jgi:hypothetical protein
VLINEIQHPDNPGGFTTSAEISSKVERIHHVGPIKNVPGLLNKAPRVFGYVSLDKRVQ